MIVQVGLGLLFFRISRAFGLQVKLAHGCTEKCHSGWAFGLRTCILAGLGLEKVVIFRIQEELGLGV